MPHSSTETKACRIELGVRYSGHDHLVTYVKKGEAGVDQCQLTCVEMRRNATKCDGNAIIKKIIIKIIIVIMSTIIIID